MLKLIIIMSKSYLMIWIVWQITNIRERINDVRKFSVFAPASSNFLILSLLTLTAKLWTLYVFFTLRMSSFFFIYLYVSEFMIFACLYICVCDLYRSPSWPVWAPRIPNSFQNTSAQPIPTDCQPNPYINPLSSYPSSLSHVTFRTRFWSTSSPLSSRSGLTDMENVSSTACITANNVYSNGKQQQSLCVIGNGFLNNMSNSRQNDNDNDANADVLVAPGIFRMPDVPRHSRKNYERSGFDTRNERNAMMSSIAKENDQQQNNVFPIAQPRISATGWLGMSKTCDCIEKGKTSPVLRLVDQARAVSSPDPLHRPDNQRALLRPAMTAQTLR